MMCRFMLAVLFALACACSSSAPRVQRAGSAPLLCDDLGAHTRPVATRSAAAQRWFDQGLTLAYSFNHDEAIRSFREAARLDPDCAMAWWGIALANGPHINFPFLPPERAQQAWEALERARAATGASPLERELIDALGRRYAEPAPEERAPLDLAYAEAMLALWRAHPRDADIGALCAEALMDLQPWDLWTPDGRPKGRTLEMQAILESVLALAPLHPGANHLYIHLVEASREPGRALASADRLRTLVPGASHMVHMPAHIDARVGHYRAAAEANQAAIEVDRRKRARVPSTGFYQVYMAHNEQFLSFVAMMQGRSQLALEAARNMVAGIPADFVQAMGPAIDGLLPIELHALVRFGLWQEILAVPPYAQELPAANAVRDYARGVALTALGRLDEAQAELFALGARVDSIDERPLGNNPARLVLAVPRKLLGGELEFRRGNQAAGLALLREAVALEDQLKYDEPPDWMMPARHTLGAALVQARAFGEAEQVYRADLERWPENGWSLFGLARSLEGLGRAEEAAGVRARFERAWADADVALRSSCFCQSGE